MATNARGGGGRSKLTLEEKLAWSISNQRTSKPEALTPDEWGKFSKALHATRKDRFEAAPIGRSWTKLVKKARRKTAKSRGM